MRRRHVLPLMAALHLAPAAPAFAQSASPDSLFRSGRFDQAESVARAALAAAPRDYAATLVLGRIALLGNRLPAARRLLARARRLEPGAREPAAYLAEAYARTGDFRRAAPLFRAAGKDAQAAEAALFARRRPYRTASFAEARIPFVQTDPLPLVQLRVNGSAPRFFLIDTGGAELLLDTAFAREVHAELAGSEAGTFAAGRQAAIGRGRVDSVQAGALVVRDVPVQLLDTRRFSAVAGGRRVDGVIGTVFLARFRSTLDYRAGELVLAPRRRGSAQAAGSIAIPFRLASDHLIVAEGSANAAGPMLFLVDTGLAGLGFTCPESTLRAAGLRPEGAELHGTGGGGAVSATPFTVATLSLGGVDERDVRGVFGAFPPALEWSQGFRIGGLVSHAFFRPHAVTFDFVAMRMYVR